MDIGLYNHRSKLKPFRTKRRNTLVLGSPGTGKTTLLTRLALSDIHAGEPIVFVDPTGDAIDEILKHIPASRQEDVLLFDPSRTPFAFNVFDAIPKDKHALYASTLLETVKGAWGYEGVATPVLDQYLRATLHTALAAPGATFASLKFILTNETYRTELLGQIDDPIVKDFWKDYQTLTAKEQRQDIASTVNKLRAFLFSPDVRNCLDQRHNRLIFKDTIVLVSLRTRELGTESANLLGALVLASLFIEGPTQNLYVDGARFATAILGNLLTSCPSVSTVVSVQYLDQVRREFVPTLLGGVGQMVAFRTSFKDAEQVEPEFNLSNDAWGLHELAPHAAYVCIDGRTTEIFTPPHNYPLGHQERKITSRCASQCTAPRDVVEKRIARFL